MNRLLISALILLAACARPEPDISGLVEHVVDGDTFFIEGQKVRLNGFDSPERGAMCTNLDVYQAGALYLANLVENKQVDCMTITTDAYDRTIATRTVDGDDIGSLMVRSGWARDWPQYSRGEYADEEAIARNARAGVWGLDCPDALWGNRTYN